MSLKDERIRQSGAAYAVFVHPTYTLFFGFQSSCYTQAFSLSSLSAAPLREFMLDMLEGIFHDGTMLASALHILNTLNTCCSYDSSMYFLKAWWNSSRVNAASCQDVPRLGLVATQVRFMSASQPQAALAGRPGFLWFLAPADVAGSAGTWNSHAPSTWSTGDGLDQGTTWIPDMKWCSFKVS